MFLGSCPKWHEYGQKDLENSLVHLTEFLEKCYRKKSIILVYECDTPVTNGMFSVTSDDLRKITEL